MNVIRRALDLSGNLHLWMPGYLAQKRAKRRNSTLPKRVWLAIADHYEPFWQQASGAVAEARVSAWRTTWPKIAAQHRDSAGRPPVYTFFYAEEEYRADLMDQLGELVDQQIADVEVHLHHNGEGETNFVSRISQFINTLHRRHGLLRLVDGRPTFGFIHGDWALDNSLPDGTCCGLNNEITLLRDLGCYADFTLPSAPSAAQTRIVNQIYWATDDPAKPRSHDTGIPMTPGETRTGDLLMIPGPLGFWWDPSRLIPHIETGEIGAHWVPNRTRMEVWLQNAPFVGEDLFIKLFTHGTQEGNSQALLSGSLNNLFNEMQSICAERSIDLHYVSAWQMYQVVHGLWKKQNPVDIVKRFFPAPFLSL